SGRGGSRGAYRKGGDGMTPIAKEEMRERLLGERRKLLEEIDALGYLHADGLSTTTEYEHYGNHMADIGTETFEHERDLALEINLRRQLQATEDALRRFAKGTYGICSNCGQPIPLERLEALPQATLCIRCKRQQEKQH
ncbi:MAG: TraR/DksA family transcriptional regulator, partial [Chloroflexota bacterium]